MLPYGVIRPQWVRFGDIDGTIFQNIVSEFNAFIQKNIYKIDVSDVTSLTSILYIFFADVVAVMTE